jgi:hypothetical protein
MPRSASVVGLAKRGVIPRKQFYTKLFFFNTVILNYCRTKVPLGVVEAVNGNIKALLRRGRGYKNLRYLLLKAQRMAALKTEFVVFKKTA